MNTLNRTTVGIADMKILKQPGAELITYALGSCLGITLYDATTQTGGMLHAMLPLSTIRPAGESINPYMFIDTGFPMLVDRLIRAGATKNKLVVKVSGGATLRQEGQTDLFKIGERNITMFKNLCWKNGLMIKASDVGGNIARTMSLNLDTGAVLLKTAAGDKTL